MGFRTGRGYIRKAEQLRGETEPVVRSWKRGKSAVLYVTASGRKVYRLYRTNIVEYDPRDATITLRDGGWATRTTHSHMRAALAEDFGFRGYYAGAENNVTVLWHRDGEYTAAIWLTPENGRAVTLSVRRPDPVAVFAKTLLGEPVLPWLVAA